ncbi:hypothetical protein [Streptomyces roseochromogenus]|uniref:Uncharacterized protein n=1 Tax=Streptomyces roseochromogenus subsp. oscitans DS 12.976 TaxID=1352936 RepID=V6KST1_STRRC|nr:hypothetical protein [Streptomyces roseochromogenus]EST35172.1 hypothetical protein M878_07290 [Streptomyces roseochromogenus subsp. oscitans DS 12.976]
MDAGAEDEVIAVPPERVTLSDRRTQRRWTVEVAPFWMTAVVVHRVLLGTVIIGLVTVGALDPDTGAGAGGWHADLRPCDPCHTSTTP